MQLSTRRSQSIFRPTNHNSVMPANWRPCLIPHWQSYCHQIRTVYQSSTTWFGCTVLDNNYTAHWSVSGKMMPELFGQSKGKSKCQILNNQIKKRYTLLQKTSAGNFTEQTKIHKPLKQFLVGVCLPHLVSMMCNGTMKLPPAGGVCLSITRCNGGVWRTGYSIFLNVSMYTQLFTPMEVLEKALRFVKVSTQRLNPINTLVLDAQTLFLSVPLYPSRNIYSYICIYR